MTLDLILPACTHVNSLAYALALWLSGWRGGGLPVPEVSRGIHTVPEPGQEVYPVPVLKLFQAFANSMNTSVKGTIRSILGQCIFVPMRDLIHGLMRDLNGRNDTAGG